MEFGKHLKQVRTQKKMSQQTLADLLFVTRQTISHWENVSLGKWKKLS